MGDRCLTSVYPRPAICLALVASLAAPAPAIASSSPAEAGEKDVAESTAADETTPEENSSDSDQPSGETSGKSSDEPGKQPAQQPEIVATEGPEKTTSMSGNAVIDADDPEATRASSELEGTALPGPVPSSVPERLPKLQAAGWWTVFGAFVLGSTGGVFAGLAEVQEDRASRLATMLDDNGNLLQYADYSETYEKHLSRGNTYQWAARGFVIAGAATLIAGITLFAVDHRRRRKGLKARRRNAPRLTATGLEVRF